MLLVVTLGLALVLVRLSLIDLREFRLPDVYTLGLLATGFAVTVLFRQVSLVEALIGAIAGYGLFWALGAWHFRRHGREGLGLGDAKLFAACGSWLGYAMLPFVLLVASLGALIFVLLIRGDQRARIAFGPWLALGFWVGWCLLVWRGGLAGLV
ncbi:prepilin peptidase [Pseudaestuariivita sp.]|uniref:prepilin peptidase n=1 Tax=Pseudaestuariivita sp. TaxID=2211669 RepID=UPI00405986FA